MSTDDIPRSSSQKKQIKFSGLVQKGVITPETPSPTEQTFASTILETDFTPEPAMEFNALERHPAGDKEVIMRILVTDVDDSPYQPRMQYKEEEIDELASAMEWGAGGPGIGEGKGEGQQDPIKVRKVGSRYQLIAGHRRIRSFRTRGWPLIRAGVVVMSDRDAELSTMVHNEGRTNLCDYEKAKLYRRAIDRNFVKTQIEVAIKFATKQNDVSRRLGMLKLPDPFIKLLDEKSDLFGATTAETIRDLLKEYPNSQETILQGVERLKEGKPENSIRNWVAQQLAKVSAAKNKKNKPKVVTDQNGKQLFTAKLEGRVISLRINAPDVDAEATLSKLYDWLHESIPKIQNNE